MKCVTYRTHLSRQYNTYARILVGDVPSAPPTMQMPFSLMSDVNLSSEIAMLTGAPKSQRVGEEQNQAG